MLATKALSVAAVACLALLPRLPTAANASSGKYFERFSHPDIQHYQPLFFDLNGLQLIVGARNYILMLNLNGFGLTPKRSHYVPASTDKRETCMMKGMRPEECHNFVTTLVPVTAGQVLLCGTNAYSPECEIRRLSKDFDLLAKSVSMSSYCPHWNTTTLVTNDTAGAGYFYGGPLDLRGIDSSIVKKRQLAPTTTPATRATASTVPDRRIVRSAQHDSKWISADAQFVFSFEDPQHEHVYFLFRETAVEDLNVPRRIFSRIGRVCKNDPGWRENWTTFLKSRLNCSLPAGSAPFYFDEIQSVDLVRDGPAGQSLLYAVFNTPSNAIQGSAVCAFALPSVREVFRGPFKYQRSSSHLWERVHADHGVFECQLAGANHTATTAAAAELRLNSIYQQVDDVVQPVDGRPLFFSQRDKFRFLAVDMVPTQHYGRVEVVFVATNDGQLLKYVKWPQLDQACLVEQRQLLQPHNRFLSMRLLKDTESLYFGTVTELIRITVHQCHEYGTELQCLQSGDPYCGWDRSKMRCSTAPNRNRADPNWNQTRHPVRVCQPRWSKWFSCGQADQTQCRCRKRPCPSSQDEPGGCIDGYQFEVTNCTQPGGWSEWSDWSGCSASCGPAKQHRTRTCTGASTSCQGSSREERPCTGLPSCQWAPWSEWTGCGGQDCAAGLRKRTRQCLDLENNPVDKDSCSGGTFVETTPCPCSRDTRWSEWIISDLNDGSLVESRMSVSLLPQTEYRYVTLKHSACCGGFVHEFRGKRFLIQECKQSQQCRRTEDLSSSGQWWSAWTEWSSCQDSIQFRERSCRRAEGQCSAPFREIRHCLPAEQSERSVPIGHPAGLHLAVVVVLLLLLALVALLAVLWLLWHRRKPPSDLLFKADLIQPRPPAQQNTYEELYHRGVSESFSSVSPSPGLVGAATAVTTLFAKSTESVPHEDLYLSLQRVPGKATVKRDFSFRAKMDDCNF